MEREGARREAAAAAASRSDTERRLARAEASLAAANDLAAVLRRSAGNGLLEALIQLFLTLHIAEEESGGLHDGSMPPTA